jgi:hypothetical protein
MHHPKVEHEKHGRGVVPCVIESNMDREECRGVIAINEFQHIIFSRFIALLPPARMLIFEFKAALRNLEPFSVPIGVAGFVMK